MTRSRRQEGRTGDLVAILLILGLIVACGGSADRPGVAGSGSSTAGTGPAATGPAGGGSGPVPSEGSGAATRRPLLIDTDLGLDDLMAIAFLAREPSVEIRAITVAGTGLVHCAAGTRNLRDLLGALGARPVPIGCGRARPATGGHPFPDPWRAAADDAYGLALAPVAGTEAAGDAATIIRTAVRDAATPPTILALGPLTNLADAIEADPGLAARVVALELMGGALRVKGNVVPDGSDPGAAVAEWNLYADPSAAARVISSGIPTTIVPLDATDAVPLDAAFPARLGADVGAAGADLANELLVRNPPIPDQSFWDQLAATALVDRSVVRFEAATVRVVTDGAEAGRLVEDPAGAAVTVATGADPAAFETRFLAGLRRGPARPDPFRLVGTIDLAFDGRACRLDVAGPHVGTYRLTFHNGSAAMAGGALAAIVPPRTWADAAAYVQTMDPTSELVDWIRPLASLTAAAGSTASGVVDLPAGIVGGACEVGTWPKIRFQLTEALDVAP